MKSARRIIAGGVLAAAIAVGAFTAGPAHATPGVHYLGTLHGQAAYGIGPSSKPDCQKRADILTKAGAKQHGSGFGNCIYVVDLGWVATSPWAA